MAIVGYEHDQAFDRPELARHDWVRDVSENEAPENDASDEDVSGGDMSVPFSLVYNHHYMAYLVGEGATVERYFIERGPGKFGLGHRKVLTPLVLPLFGYLRHINVFVTSVW